MSWKDLVLQHRGGVQTDTTSIAPILSEPEPEEEEEAIPSWKRLIAEARQPAQEPGADPALPPKFQTPVELPQTYDFQQATSATTARATTSADQLVLQEIDRIQKGETPLVSQFTEQGDPVPAKTDIDSVMETIGKFEGEYSYGNVNWAADLEQRFGATKGDSYTDHTGRQYYHADFPTPELGIEAARHVATNIWNSPDVDKDPIKFASAYTGLPEDDETVKNYAFDIRQNMQKAAEEAPPVQVQTQPMPSEVPASSIVGGTDDIPVMPGTVRGFGLRERQEQGLKKPLDPIPFDEKLKIAAKNLSADDPYVSFQQFYEQNPLLAKDREYRKELYKIKDEFQYPWKGPSILPRPLWEAAKYGAFNTLDKITLGAIKNVVDKPLLAWALDEQRHAVPWSKDTAFNKSWRLVQGGLDAYGSVVPYMYFPHTTVLGSMAVFGGVSGAGQILDPDQREGLTLDEWAVHTGFSSLLGSVFPMLSRLGGEVIAQPNNLKALGQYLLQVKAITAATSAEAMAGDMYNYAKENPQLPMMDVFIQVGSKHVNNPEQIIKHLATMAFLHGQGAGKRISKTGRANAGQMQKMVQGAKVFYKDMPAWAGGKPKTVAEAQRFWNQWMERRDVIKEALDPYRLEAEAAEGRARTKTLKERKAAVKVPEETGVVKPEDKIREMPAPEQIEEIKQMGYTEAQAFGMTGDQRVKTIMGEGFEGREAPIKKVAEPAEPVVAPKVEEKLVSPKEATEAPPKREFMQTREIKTTDDLIGFVTRQKMYNRNVKPEEQEILLKQAFTDKELDRITESIIEAHNYIKAQGGEREGYPADHQPRQIGNALRKITKYESLLLRAVADQRQINLKKGAEKEKWINRLENRTRANIEEVLKIKTGDDVPVYLQRPFKEKAPKVGEDRLSESDLFGEAEPPKAEKPVEVDRRAERLMEALDLQYEEALQRIASAEEPTNFINNIFTDIKSDKNFKERELDARKYLEDQKFTKASLWSIAERMGSITMRKSDTKAELINDIISSGEVSFSVKVKKKRPEQFPEPNSFEPPEVEAPKVEAPKKITKPEGESFADDVLRMDKLNEETLQNKYGESEESTLYNLFNKDFKKATKNLEEGKDYDRYLDQRGPEYSVMYNAKYTGYNPNGKKVDAKDAARRNKALKAIRAELKIIGLEKWADVWEKEIKDSKRYSESETKSKFTEWIDKQMGDFVSEMEVARGLKIEDLKPAEILEIFGFVARGRGGVRSKNNVERIDEPNWGDSGGKNPRLKFQPEGNKPVILKGAELVKLIKEASGEGSLTRNIREAEKGKQESLVGVEQKKLDPVTFIKDVFRDVKSNKTLEERERDTQKYLEDNKFHKESLRSIATRLGAVDVKASDSKAEIIERIMISGGIGFKRAQRKKTETAPTTKKGTVAKGMEPTEMKVGDIKIDESKFQPREEYDEAVIKSVAEKFDPAKWEPPVVWKDPATGDHIIVSGHHRQKGLERGGMEKAEYIVLPKGTKLSDAVEFAETSNLQRTQQSDFENASTVRRRVEKGDSYSKIAEDLPGIAPRAKTDQSRVAAVKKLENLSHLDEGGLFKENYEKPNDFAKIVSLSDFVGSMRKKYPWLTNTHEKDMFAFFYTKYGVAKGPVGDAKLDIMDGLAKMDKSTEKMPRLDWLDKGLVTGQEARNPELSKELTEKRRLHNKLGLQLESEISDQLRTSINKDRALLDKEIKEIERGLGLEAEAQETLFMGAKQRTIFGEWATPEKTKTESDLSREEIIRERKKQIERDEAFINQRVTEGKLTETTADAQKRKIAMDKRILAEEAGQKDLFGEEKPEQGALFSEGKTGEAKETYNENTEWKDSNLRKATTLRDVGKNLLQNLDKRPGQHVRFGLIKRWKRKALGFFQPGSGIIRVKNINDINVLSHEIGHELDIHMFKFHETVEMPTNIELNKIEKVVRMGLGRKNQKTRDKLIETYRRKYGSEVVDTIMDRAELWGELQGLLNAVGYPKRLWSVKEGIAEFTRLYVTDPKLARQASKFHEIFEDVMIENPNIQDALLSARRQYKQFQEQDPRAKLHSTVVRGKQEDTNFLEGIVRYGRKLTFNLMDTTEPWRKLETELLKVNPKMSGADSPLNRLLSLIGIDGKAKQMIENQPFLLEGNKVVFQKNVKPLMKILKEPMKQGQNVLDQYGNYLVGLRNLELHRTGKGGAATLSEADSQAGVKLIEAQYGTKKMQKFSNDMQAYQDVLLRYYRDSGMISQEAYQKIKAENGYYIPFKRFFAEYELQGQSYSVSKYLRDTSTQKVRKIGKESPREVIDPFESVLQNTYDLISGADQNRAKISLIRSLNSLDKTLVVEIPKNVIKKRFVLETGELEFTKEAEKPTDRGIITVRHNGEAKFYELPKEYHDAFMSITEPVAQMRALFAAPTRWLRQGAVVYDPTFGIRNIARDQTSAIFYSKHGYNPMDFGRGIWSAVRNDKAYQRFLASGADQSFLAATDVILRRNIHKGQFDTKLQSRWKRYKNPLFLLQDFNRATEIGTRVGAFKKAYNKTGDVFKAMKEGREIAADYGIKGEWMNNASQLYPFLNARLQHVRMTKESLSRERLKTTLGRGLLYVAGPSAMNWMNNNKDEDIRALYQELPGWRKIGFWNIHVPGTHSFIMVPKGAYGVAFGGGVEATLDWMLHNDTSLLKELPEGVLTEVSPITNYTDIIPQFVKPPAEAFAGKYLFTGKPTVPQSLEGLEPWEQYDDSTSRIMIKLGEKTGLSPMKIQALLRGYFAGSGQGPLYVVDETLEALGLIEPSPQDRWSRLSRLPITKAFVSKPAIGTRGESVRKMYEKLDEIEAINRQVNRYLKQNRPEKIHQYLSEKGRDPDYKWYLNNSAEIGKFKTVLRAMRDFELAINKNTSIKNPREVIEGFQLEITKTAQELMKAYQNNDLFMLEDVVIGKYLDEKHKQRMLERERKAIKRQYR